MEPDSALQVAFDFESRSFQLRSWLDLSGTTSTSGLASHMALSRLCPVPPLRIATDAGYNNTWALNMIRIGTSGWHYKHWRGPFYPDTCPQTKMLEFYLNHFDTVEINNSFYKLPEPETFSCWREQTPAGFCFAVKASRFITHNKKLGDAQNALHNLLPRAELLREKLGPVLFQLPPKWNVNPERLEQFLHALPHGRRRRYAFEFRNATWLVPEVYNILRRHNAAFCMFDLAGYQTPMEVTADWTYVRLHGPGGKYQGSYTAGQLQEWAERISAWSRSMQAVYVYFDNDQAGYAAQNAMELKHVLETKQSKVA